jgi:hypothetical protein
LYLLPGMPLDIGKQFIEKLFLSSVPILIKSSNNVI